MGAEYVLAFDTANEVIAIGIGRLCANERAVELAYADKVAAHRASNTQLVPRIDAALKAAGVARADIACVAVGRGPGSFTGVRIAMATAKGIASALEVPLVGISTLDAVAWGAWKAGARGRVLVAADAMRKEVYPVAFDVCDAGVTRRTADCVVKAAAFAEELEEGAESNALFAEDLRGESAGATEGVSHNLFITGDALTKYAELFAPYGELLPESTWTLTGEGLLLAVQAAWRAGEIEPRDAARHNSAFALPVYTRLSDAEENERIRLAKNDPKNLAAGVQDVVPRADRRATMHDSAILNARADEQGITYKPLDAAHAEAVAELESRRMGSDAWNVALVADELPRADRIWWAAYAQDALVGYAGGWMVDGDVQILKVAVEPEFTRRGIARELMARVAADARDLGASTCSLEVRASNAGAQAFYKALGLAALGVRPRYYSDHEDAVIMQGALPVATHDVAGMTLQVNAREGTPAATHAADLTSAHPLILAIESSCDETAAAIVDGAGQLVSDVVASQIDFHARFGGVVPEIASRKHIEAICGVCDECLEVAATNLGVPSMRWRDLSAVAVTYAPGLVGALVVGVAFAKGAAWAAELPIIGVNHLEGHLYANKLAAPDVRPPLVASLVSGGNTLLVHVRDWGDYEILGATIDDAVGEAFDKVAKALGLGYPGGPAVSKQAAQGNPAAIAFPRAMMHSGDLRFSLSGLKTAVVTYINAEREAGRELNIPDICASFQQAVVDVQVSKAKKALEQTGAREFCLGGGVAANPALRAAYETMCAKKGVKLRMPPLHACGDNAGMIALVAHDRYAQGKFFDLDFDALAHANLNEPY